MAVKFALLAALCVAQAFAFPPSSEEMEKAATGKDFRIIMSCFNNQMNNVDAMVEKVAGLAQVVVDGVEEDIRENVREALKQTEKPVAQIGVVLKEIHRDMYISLNRLDVPKAYEALMSGVRTIEGIEKGIRQGLNEVKVNNPALADAMDWYMRYLPFAMEVMIPRMRRDFGECLFIGRPDNLM